MQTTAKTEKRVSKAFGKKIFLLGKFKSGENFWLEEAKWDCDWYWAFGYIETYTNKNPALARDIESHQHYNSLCFLKPEYWDTEKNCFRGGDYVHIFKDHNGIAETVLTEAEQWELSDLMKSFYTLKDTAELFHQGNSHLTSVSGLDLKDLEREKRINEVLLPKLFKRVYELLTPKETI